MRLAELASTLCDETLKATYESGRFGRFCKFALDQFVWLDVILSWKNISTTPFDKAVSDKCGEMLSRKEGRCKRKRGLSPKSFTG